MSTVNIVEVELLGNSDDRKQNIVNTIVETIEEAGSKRKLYSEEIERKVSKKKEGSLQSENPSESLEHSQERKCPPARHHEEKSRRNFLFLANQGSPSRHKGKNSVLVISPLGKLKKQDGIKCKIKPVKIKRMCGIFEDRSALPDSVKPKFKEMEKGD